MTPFKTSNPIVNELIRTETPPSNELLQQLLGLPRQFLISDLESVLTHIIDHSDGEEERSLVALHCIFLLTELKSNESLPLLLKLCEQEDDFLDFYFDDHTSETMWQDILIMGKSNLDTLFDFLKNNDMKAIGTRLVANGLTQIALHFPDKRIKIIDGLTNIYKHLFEHNKSYKIDFSDQLIINDLNAVELLDIAKLFFDNDRIEDYVEWNTFLSDMDSIKEGTRTLLSIQERYDCFATPDILFDRELENIRDMQPETLEELEIVQKMSDELFKSKGISLTEIKKSIGRNDLCFCGSGKKYKHCCIDK